MSMAWDWIPVPPVRLMSLLIVHSNRLAALKKHEQMYQNRGDPEVVLQEACMRPTTIQPRSSSNPGSPQPEAITGRARPKMRSPRATWGDHVPVES